MFIQEHNCETGEITLRDLTAQEIEQREKDIADFLAQKAEAETQAAAKAALLDRLGITADEAKLLLS
jgi:hypothetical protein